VASPNVLLLRTLAAGAVLLAGCGRVNYRAFPDAAVVTDLGGETDGGVIPPVDGGSPSDAGPEQDAGTLPDSGPIDAGTLPDSGPIDAGPIDAGPPPTFVCGTSTVVDADGRSYPTVAIGAQCWFAANLAVGARVAAATGQTNNGAVEKFCYGDAATCTDTSLYTWDEAMQYSTTSGARGICPAGWHIPSELDWEALERALGMSEVDIATMDFRGAPVGTKLKIGGSSGFNALLVGIRADDGSWFATGSDTFFWASDSAGLSASSRRLTNFAGLDGTVQRYGYIQTNAFSIRCLKD
jgi:uncharacterized protein (TIGR02145 family)